MKTITLSKGGTAERTIPVESIQIPDLWAIAHEQEYTHNKAAILECWHIAHDMRRALQEEANSHDALLAALRECITEDGAAGLQEGLGRMKRRILAINDIARNAIAQATGQEIFTPAISDNLNERLK